MNNMTFSLEPHQIVKINKWIDKQGVRPVGAIGGRFTYSFSPTSIGTVVKVSDCITGKELDVTDYQDW